ncbi:hypothetical protein ACJIZ3_004442 [Penstemon smallii]|uniref:Morc S5 domain-containing protein n=1 Tax=Penstemon smallii TaxID=265156 RepID=A0ABD3S272_9LAMI
MAKDNIIQVKTELIDHNIVSEQTPNSFPNRPTSVIEISSSDSDSDSDSDASSSSSDENSNKRPRDSDGGDDNAKKKKKKYRKSVEDANAILPVGFLDPLPSKHTPLRIPSSSLALTSAAKSNGVVVESSGKQFWKAGDYEGAPGGDWNSTDGGMDHVRVHPKFLHSNATSHKWVLGALAELLDNSLDEVCNGATYVSIDMAINKKDGSKMLLIEDNGGGMSPEKMRHCMSLGYSAKSKLINTIGQYGNGFKTSTMRLGADVIVFSRCCGTDERSPMQSIGLLSYTFLKKTGKEDIVVPMLDYERREQDWNKIVRPSVDWNVNVETIVQWSPFSSEADLLRQFNQIKDHGTRIIIYNLWEDDEGLLELDFDTDPHDIQIRGVNRDEKSIDMAKKHPNSKHFLTYRHSLRSYAAILYLRVPHGFRMILRGKDIEHHNIVNDMMMSQEIIYRPQHVAGADGLQKDSNMVAVVTIGFVKDAKAHIDVQGFNVYHKNRLIKPFWKVWHPPGSDGRGVIGVLEANFVEPAHDKQDFERTTVLARLDKKLIEMQRNYWSKNCHKIGYAPRRNKNVNEKETSPNSVPQSSPKSKRTASADKTQTKSVDKGYNNGHLNGKGDARTPRKRPSYAELSISSAEDVSDDDRQNHTSKKWTNGSSSKGKDGSAKPSVFKHQEATQFKTQAERPLRATRNTNPKENGLNHTGFSPSSSSSLALAQLKEENLQLKERLKRKEDEILGDLLQDMQKEKERSKSLEAQLQEANKKHEELSKEQESLIDIFTEERQRRDIEEENLRKKLKEASNTIQKLLDRVKFLEKSSNKR